MTRDGLSIAERLRDIGIPDTGSREIQEITKIANYWRICITLAEASRTYRPQFSKMQLGTILAYHPTRGRGQDRYVHAEVQMIVHYETSTAIDKWPRAIGSSKEACYLCHSFVSAHGWFQVSKAHRQLYNKWTIPNLRAYNDATLVRFREAIRLMDQDVIQARHSYGAVNRHFPLQSSINLARIEMP